MIDWQTIANIATSITLIVAIVVFICELISRRRERKFSIFLRLLDCYNQIMTERRHKWKVIKKKIQTNKKTSKEIGDKTSTIDYLLTRVRQKEPLYAIEHGLLEDEIKSLNILNELCEYASKDEQMRLVLNVLYSSEVSYYQNRHKDILLILDREKKLRLFTIPRYEHLCKFKICNYFDSIDKNIT